ncbi:hypothetical protein MARHY2631 [Marinobacter nauticus ATCC 49840]|nr:hypothetical protein MARHY2631 [Marinobacter nauticus ATCC 49840]
MQACLYPLKHSVVNLKGFSGEVTAFWLAHLGSLSAPFTILSVWHKPAELADYLLSRVCVRMFGLFSNILFTQGTFGNGRNGRTIQPT